jgi:hypothetical protein
VHCKKKRQQLFAGALFLLNFERADFGLIGGKNPKSKIVGVYTKSGLKTPFIS